MCATRVHAHAARFPPTVAAVPTATDQRVDLVQGEDLRTRLLDPDALDDDPQQAAITLYDYLHWRLLEVAPGYGTPWD